MGPGSGGGYKCIRGTRPLSSVLDKHNSSTHYHVKYNIIPCLVSCPMTDSLHIVCVCLQSTTPPLMNLCPTNRREVQTNMQSATDQWESRTRGSQWPPQQTILVADDIPFYRQWLPVPFSDCHCWLIPYFWLRSYCPPPCSDNRENVRVRRRSVT